MGRYIPIDEIKDGMMLGEPIINSFGQTLLPAGASLKQSHAGFLKTWNIQTVCIKQDDAEEDFVISDDLKQLADDRVAKRLRWQPRNQYESEIIKICFLQAANIIAKRNVG